MAKGDDTHGSLVGFAVLVMGLCNRIPRSASASRKTASGLPKRSLTQE